MFYLDVSMEVLYYSPLLVRLGKYPHNLTDIVTNCISISSSPKGPFIFPKVISMSISVLSLPPFPVKLGYAYRLKTQIISLNYPSLQAPMCVHEAHVNKLFSLPLNNRLTTVLHPNTHHPNSKTKISITLRQPFSAPATHLPSESQGIYL